MTWGWSFQGAKVTKIFTCARQHSLSMAFTTEEILSYFTVGGANPLASRLPENIDILPTPGHGLYARGRDEAERRHRDDFFVHHGEPEDDPQSPDYGESPVYNVPVHDKDAKIEDIDVDEDYFQLPPPRDDYAEDTGVLHLYERYSFAANDMPHLPVTERREEIIRTIESNQVTIIQGATGSGKSTLVPQYILEHYAHHKKHCNIVCTQPRRIATRSIARYIAEKRTWQLGTLVGYHIYNDKVTSEDTRLTFVTTGVLLEKLIGMKNMNEYTHVILDEVSRKRRRGRPFSLEQCKKEGGAERKCGGDSWENFEVIFFALHVGT